MARAAFSKATPAAPSQFEGENRAVAERLSPSPLDGLFVGARMLSILGRIPVPSAWSRWGLRLIAQSARSSRAHRTWPVRLDGVASAEISFPRKYMFSLCCVNWIGIGGTFMTAPT
jgi:hypothetical protein